MGFVDLVGIASNYVKADLNLTDSQANIFPSLVFFWFLIFSVPTGMLMNRIGRKKTVLLSLVITFASLLLPVFGDGYVLMLLSFSLLGIGNALMQTSLNPLLSNIVSGEMCIRDRSGFIRGHNQQVHPFGYQFTNVFCLTVIIVDGSTDVHLHIFVEMGFTEYLTVHLAPPFILATLGNADTETCLAPGAGNRHSPKHEQKE